MFAALMFASFVALGSSVLFWREWFQHMNHLRQWQKDLESYKTTLEQMQHEIGAMLLLVEVAKDAAALDEFPAPKTVH